MPFTSHTALKHALRISVALAFVAATTTAFAPVPTDSRAVQRSCALVVSKARSLEQPSRVVASACADSPDGRALRALRSGNTLLVTFWQDANFGGAQTSIYGDSGPCDSSGYTFNDTNGANNAVNGISSYRVYNSCNTSAIWNQTSENGAGTGNLDGDVSYVGDQWNDNVQSMKVWSS